MFVSDLKPVMVRLPPDVYEKLRVQAFRSAIPPAVLARSLIKQQLESFEGPAEGLEEPSPAPSPASTSPSSPAPSSSPRRRSANAKRRKNKKRAR
jgi:hypothetical protein